MVIIKKTYSRSRTIMSSIIAFTMVVAGFIAIMISPKSEKLSLVSLITGASVAHADFVSDSGGGDSGGGCDAGDDNGMSDSNDGSDSCDAQCGPDGASTGDGSDGDQ